jgi:multicomponent Na+:H+ antiporter subunit E
MIREMLTIPHRAAQFVTLYLWDLLRSGVRIALDVLRPSLANRPAVLVMPLEARTDFEVLAVANLISLTPGTLALDVSADRTKLYLHVMGAEPGATDQVVQHCKRTVERPLLALLRVGGRNAVPHGPALAGAARQRSEVKDEEEVSS